MLELLVQPRRSASCQAVLSVEGCLAVRSLGCLEVVYMLLSDRPCSFSRCKLSLSIA